MVSAAIRRSPVRAGYISILSRTSTPVLVLCSQSAMQSVWTFLAYLWLAQYSFPSQFQAQGAVETCADCPLSFGDFVYDSKCFEPGNGGYGSHTLCFYKEENQSPVGGYCTYDQNGALIGSDGISDCPSTAASDSTDCPSCSSYPTA